MPKYEKLDPNLKRARREFKAHYDAMMKLIEKHMPSGSWVAASMSDQLSIVCNKFMDNTDSRIKVDDFGFSVGAKIGPPYARSPIYETDAYRKAPVLKLVANELRPEDWTGIPNTDPKND